MGILRNFLYKVLGSSYDIFGNSSGKSVILDLEGFPGQTLKKELYNNSGVISIPGKGTKTIYVPIDPSGRYGICIACNNYNLNFTIQEGETVIYSTSADGNTIKSQIKLTVDGKIELNGSSKTLVTYSELNTALQTLITGLNSLLATKLDGGGAPGTLTLDISAAETSTVKTGG